MKIFEVLAQEAEAKWAESKYDVSVFPELATELLHRFQYSLSLEQLNAHISEWLLKSVTLPKQISLHNTFGQPSLTLFNNGKFIVDLYIWVDFDTSIHSHGFRGAFRVLHGQSLHETFNAKTLKEVASDLRFVDMQDVALEKLSVGDVRTIAAGLDLTHRVIHLENPTITLCVRTVSDTSLKQWTYLPTGLAVQKNDVNEDLIKKVYYFQYLLGRNESSALVFLESLLSELSLSSQIHLYEAVASGSIPLASLVSEAIAESIVGKYQWTDWWKLYEQSHMAQMHGLFFEGCSQPVERLIAHFMNSGYAFARVRPLLTQFSTETPIEIAIRLIDEPGIFNFDLSMEDRAVIKSLLREPQKVVPLHLKQFSQITLMRRFLAEC